MSEYEAIGYKWQELKQILDELPPERYNAVLAFARSLIGRGAT